MNAAEQDQVRELWRSAAEAPGAFRSRGWIVSGSDSHSCSPDGWVGVVQLGDAVVVAAPTALAPGLRHKMAYADDLRSLTEPQVASTTLGPAEQTLGPALLFYGTMTPTSTTATSATLDVNTANAVHGPCQLDDPLVAPILLDSSEEERTESGIEDMSSGLYIALDDDGQPAAACGWAPWPHHVAHMGILTATSGRGRGFGRVAARAALAAAVSERLLPQWRAAEANVASQALARRLGLVEFGRQFSYRPQ